MKRKILSSILIVTSLNLFLSCTPTQTITQTIGKEELEKDDIIHSAVLSSGEEIEFDENGARYSVGGTITGLLEGGDSLTISMAKVREIRADKVPSINLDDITDENISEVILKNKQVVCLNSGHKEIYDGNIAIIGKSHLNKEIIINEKPIFEVRVTKPSVIAKKDLAEMPHTKIFELVTYSQNRLYKFDSSGANVSNIRDVYTGRTHDGRYVDVPLDEIVSVNAEYPDEVLSAGDELLVAGIWVGVILIVVIALLEQGAFDFDIYGN